MKRKQKKKKNASSDEDYFEANSFATSCFTQFRILFVRTFMTILRLDEIVATLRGRMDVLRDLLAALLVSIRRSVGNSLNSDVDFCG